MGALGVTPCLQDAFGCGFMIKPIGNVVHLLSCSESSIGKEKTYPVALK
jgi:hypothetical protein